MQKQAKITSKGQITIPVEVRKILGVRAGDKLLSGNDEAGAGVRPVRKGMQRWLAQRSHRACAGLERCFASSQSKRIPSTN
jgi:AbrB family looped-hinge helix DNA binding protein